MTIVNKIKSFFTRIAARFPTPLPIGVTSFNKWAGEVIALSGLPDNDSVRWSLAINIMHLGSDRARVPKILMADLLRKGAANQIAAAVVQDLKAKQQAEIEAAKKAAESTATTTEAPAVETASASAS